MAYALATAYCSATITHPIIKTSWFAIATKGDAVIFDGEAGIIPLYLQVQTNGASGIANSASVGWSYTVIRVTDAADSVTDTSISYDTAVDNQRPKGGYFIRNPSTGEIMYVISDSGYASGQSGDLVVIRGALGTTAATIADDQYLDVMCSLYFYGEGTGQVPIVYLSMPKDPRAAMW